MTSSIFTPTAATGWAWGRGVLYISACTECCVCPLPFLWPARRLPLCLAVPALPWVKDSPELGKSSAAWGHDPVGRKPAARADISRCLKEAENDRAKSLKQERNSFLVTQRHQGWGCARQLGQSDSLLPPKVSLLCCFRKLGVSNKHKSSCKRRSRQLQSEGSKPSLWGCHELRFRRNIQPVWGLLQPKMPQNVAGPRQRMRGERSVKFLCSHSEETEFLYFKHWLSQFS